MGVYFITPVIAGWYVMQWTNGVAKRNLREVGTLPESKIGKLHVRHQNKQLEKVLNAAEHQDVVLHQVKA